MDSVSSLPLTSLSLSHTANRTEPALEDVACVFQDVGVTLAELSTYTRLVESSSLTPLPHFPLTRHSAHVYSRPSTPVTRPRPSLSLSEEDDEEEDVIPAHFPPLPSKKAEVDKGTEHEAAQFFLGEVTALGVLCCFALLFV